MAEDKACLCNSCHYWRPLEWVSYLGECENPASRSYRRPVFSDKPTEECYTTRSLENLDFVWCQSHRETIPSLELPDHRVCKLYAGSAVFPVEEMAEFTVAGD